MRGRSYRHQKLSATGVSISICPRSIWLERDIRRPMCVGRHATSAASASRTIFFSSVSRFVRVSASPKQPQSLTGSAMYIHTVTAVMTTMNSSVSLAVTLLLIAVSMNAPSVNSTMLSDTDIRSVSISGSDSDGGMAAR